MIVELSKFYGWPPAGPGAAWNLTGTELVWWAQGAAGIIKRLANPSAGKG